MPTIAREGPFRIVIFSNDHEPAHVHVMVGGNKLVIQLVGQDGRPQLREIVGKVKHQEAKQALELVTRNYDTYLEKWHEIHGNDPTQ